MDTFEQEAPEELAPEAKAICDAIANGARAVALGQITAALIPTFAGVVRDIGVIDAETMVIDSAQRIAAKLGILS